MIVVYEAARASPADLAKENAQLDLSLPKSSRYERSFVLSIVVSAKVRVVDYHVFKDVVNRYYAKHVGGDQRPVFFDIPSVYPELELVTRAYADIRHELDRLLDDQGLYRRMAAAGPERMGRSGILPVVVARVMSLLSELEGP